MTPSPPAPQARYCPDCRARLVNDFDQDYGLYWRCDSCGFRASANKPAPAPAVTADTLRAATVYIASKTKYAPKWRELRDAGYRIIATWIDEAGPGESTDLGDLAERCIREAKDADVFIVYCEAGDVLKGAWVEAGARLAAGKVVLAVGPFDRSAFTHHVNWRHRESMDAALAVADACRAGPATPAKDYREACAEALAYLAGRDFCTPAEGYSDIRHALSSAIYEGYKMGQRDGGGGAGVAGDATTTALTAEERREVEIMRIWRDSGAKGSTADVAGLLTIIDRISSGGVPRRPTPPRLTAAEATVVGDCIQYLYDCGPTRLAAQLLAVRDRLTAAADAAGTADDAPGTTPTAEAEPIEVMPPTHPFTKDERQRIDDYVAGWKASRAGGDAPGPQRKEQP